MSWFEALMIVAFGAAWPLSILKSWRSSTNKGKSLPFLIVIWMGYLCGVLHKSIYHLDAVIVLYCINMLMVSADIALFFRNSSATRSSAASTSI